MDHTLQGFDFRTGAYGHPNGKAWEQCKGRSHVGFFVNLDGHAVQIGRDLFQAINAWNYESTKLIAALSEEDCALLRRVIAAQRQSGYRPTAVGVATADRMEEDLNAR